MTKAEQCVPIESSISKHFWIKLAIPGYKGLFTVDSNQITELARFGNIELVSVLSHKYYRKGEWPEDKSVFTEMTEYTPKEFATRAKKFRLEIFINSDTLLEEAEDIHHSESQIIDIEPPYNRVITKQEIVAAQIDKIILDSIKVYALKNIGTINQELLVKDIFPILLTAIFLSFMANKEPGAALLLYAYIVKMSLSNFVHLARYPANDTYPGISWSLLDSFSPEKTIKLLHKSRNASSIRLKKPDIIRNEDHSWLQTDNFSSTIHASSRK